MVGPCSCSENGVSDIFVPKGTLEILALGPALSSHLSLLSRAFLCDFFFFLLLPVTFP